MACHMSHATSKSLDIKLKIDLFYDLSVQNLIYPIDCEIFHVKS